MKKLAGKVAVITDGSSGIGLAAAKKFIEEGAYVFITGRRETELAKAKLELGKNVTTVRGDVANLADLDRLYGTTTPNVKNSTLRPTSHMCAAANGPKSLNVPLREPPGCLPRVVPGEIKVLPSDGGEIGEATR